MAIVLAPPNTFAVMPVSSKSRLLKRPQRRRGILVLVSVINVIEKSNPTRTGNTNTSRIFPDHDQFFSPTHEHVATKVDRFLDFIILGAL